MKSICIIDSGVDLPDDYPEIASHYEVMSDFSIERLDRGIDALGHGTAIAGILRRHAPDSELHSIRVIGKSPHGDHSGNLLTALALATRHPEWDILNISVGIPRPDPQLRDLISELVADGRTIVAAVDNDLSRKTWPAAFPEVIAVEHDHYPAPLDYRQDERDRSKYFANGIYIQAPRTRASGGGTECFTGSSFAAPHISALIATDELQIAESSPSLISFSSPSRFASAASD